MQVEIKCKQVVYYSQIVEMPKEDFEKLKECDYTVSDSEEEYGIIEGYINHGEIFDTDHEYDDFEIREYKKKK